MQENLSSLRHQFKELLSIKVTRCLGMKNTKSLAVILLFSVHALVMEVSLTDPVSRQSNVGIFDFSDIELALSERITVYPHICFFGIQYTPCSIIFLLECH